MTNSRRQPRGARCGTAIAYGLIAALASMACIGLAAAL